MADIEIINGKKTIVAPKSIKIKMKLEEPKETFEKILEISNKTKNQPKS